MGDLEIVVKGGNSLEIVTSAVTYFWPQILKSPEVHPLVKIPDKLDQVGSQAEKLAAEELAQVEDWVVCYPVGVATEEPGLGRLPHPGNHMEMVHEPFIGR